MSNFSLPLFLSGLCSESLGPPQQQILRVLSFLDLVPAILFSAKK